MKVREAREKMDSLKQLYDNAVKIQNYCLRKKAADGAITDFGAITDLEEKSCINTSLRTFATCVATFAADERKRISDIIDNADVKID